VIPPRSRVSCSGLFAWLETEEGKEEEEAAQFSWQIVVARKGIARLRTFSF